MIEEISLERAGGQDLRQRLVSLNTCALFGAHRLALNPSGASRIRLPPGSLSSYRDLSEMEVGHFAAQPVFLFRPSPLTRALSCPSATSLSPDAELARRFLVLVRDLARHAISSPAALLAIDPADIETARRLTDDEIEVLQKSPALTFEPRIEPSPDLRSITTDGWEQDRFLIELARDLDRQVRRTESIGLGAHLPTNPASQPITAEEPTQAPARSRRSRNTTLKHFDDVRVIRRLAALGARAQAIRMAVGGAWTHSSIALVTRNYLGHVDRPGRPATAISSSPSPRDKIHLTIAYLLHALARRWPLSDPDTLADAYELYVFIARHISEARVEIESCIPFMGDIQRVGLQLANCRVCSAPRLVPAHYLRGRFTCDKCSVKGPRGKPANPPLKTGFLCPTAG